MICRLAERDDDVERSQLYGLRGQKQGEIDLFCRLRDRAADPRAYRTIQCRRVERMSPGKIEQTVTAFLAGCWRDRSAEFVLATPVRLVERNHADAVRAAEQRLAGAGIVFRVWDGDALVAKLRSAPELVWECGAPGATFWPRP